MTTISKLSNVAAAAGGLTLTDRTVTGTVPAFNTGGSGGGGGFGGGGSGGSGGGGGGGGFTGGGTSSFNTNSYTVTGVDISHGQLGPLSTGTISSGRTFTTADDSKDVALVEASYATSEKLKVGSTIAVGNSKGTATNFTVVGIVSEPSGDSPSDVYLPLGVAQSLANLKSDVNTIYVSATSNNDITTLASTIKSTVSGSTVTDENSLASEVTGSLSSAASLANSLGKWLAIAVLIAAFLLASLLTMSAVSRRIREFGTLKALGWRSRRVVGQVLGESIAIGIVGGVVGVGLGFLGAALVDHFSGSLSASLGSATGSATPGGAQRFGGAGGGTGGTGGDQPLPRRLRQRGAHRRHGRGAPVRAGDDHRDRPRRGPRGPRRADRRRVRRLAGGAAAPRSGTVQGRLSGPERKSQPMYKLTKVVKDYPKGRDVVHALRGVNLEIADGEWLSIQGPTGHGKSTLLQLLGGLDRPTSGSLDLNGQDLAKLGETAMTKVRAANIGFIFQTFNLIPTLSAQENVETALVPLGISNASRKSRAAEALASVGLSDRARHLPSELSGGQQQRVAIARALVKEPRVLLADEPTGNLDEDTRDEIIALLEKLWQDNGLTMVMVTHDSTIARRAQRLGTMRNGQLTVKQTVK